MITAQDCHGITAMMPAFATPDASDLLATATIDVGNLQAGVDRIVRDGIDVIATTGSFGECYGLLLDEFATLARATVEAVDDRVPLFIGCTSPNSREVAQKMKIIREAGGQGALIGVPYYLPSSVENAVQFYRDLAEAFPDIAVAIYHNPRWHRVEIPVEAFTEITRIPNIVAMKDSHRDEATFSRLSDTVKGKISLFPGQHQYYPYCTLGASGCWSIDVWMGPWPVLALRDTIARGDYGRAQQLMEELASPDAMDVQWREVPSKLSVKHAGYCDPGPLRRPFVHVPPNVVERAHQRAERWQTLCAKYRPEVEASRSASAAAL